jgi:hypothetical protein
MTSHVLSIGQCSADDYRLSRVLSVEADAHVDRASTADIARRMMAEKPYDLVLVNRVLDGDGSSGVDLIGEMASVAGSPCMMLVSDYADAQAAAVGKGAKKGFGKSALGTPEVGQLLREALRSCTRAGAAPRVVAAPKA